MRYWCRRLEVKLAIQLLRSPSGCVNVVVLLLTRLYVFVLIHKHKHKHKHTNAERERERERETPLLSTEAFTGRSCLRGSIDKRRCNYRACAVYLNVLCRCVSGGRWTDKYNTPNAYSHIHTHAHPRKPTATRKQTSRLRAGPIRGWDDKKQEKQERKEKQPTKYQKKHQRSPPPTTTTRQKQHVSVAPSRFCWPISSVGCRNSDENDESASAYTCRLTDSICFRIGLSSRPLASLAILSDM